MKNEYFYKQANYTLLLIKISMNPIDLKFPIIVQLFFSECNMRKTIILLCCFFMSQISFAFNANDSLQACFDKLDAVDITMQNFRRENTVLKSEIAMLNTVVSAQSRTIDSLKSSISETNNNISLLVDSLNINIISNKEQIQINSDTLNTTIKMKSRTGLWIFIALGLIVSVLAFMFGKLLAKRDDELTSLSVKADKLNEEIINRLSLEISEIQKISKQFSTISTANGEDTDSEQKLITTLADRITFMEMTLYKMDSSVRGHKQLSKSIRQMKDNLLANGYELVDMLGRDYHDGMKVSANIIDDETIPEGKQIITGIIKPQINYRGKMIQSAQITVSQNL